MTEITLNIGLEQLAHSIALETNEDRIVEFVKYLDEAVGMWSFTDATHKYFHAEMKRARKDGWTND